MYYTTYCGRITRLEAIIRLRRYSFVTGLEAVVRLRRYSFVTGLKAVVRTSTHTPTVPSPEVDEVTLFGRGTDTSTAIAAHGGTAALRLALVVREDEQVIVVQGDRRTSQRFIRSICLESLCGRREIGRQIDVVIGTNGLRRKRIRNQVVHEVFLRGRSRTRTRLHQRCGKALTCALGPVRQSHQHSDVRQKQKNQHTD